MHKYIKNILIKIKLFIICLFLFPVVSVFGMNSEQEAQKRMMPFKLGFEFQEQNGLCPWALNDNDVQKKALFSVKDKKTGQSLWHLVIDTNDIEFVTVPFSNDQRKLLKSSIKSIHFSVESLEKIINQKGKLSFSEWIAEIEKPLLERGLVLDKENLFQEVKEKHLIKPVDTEEKIPNSFKEEDQKQDFSKRWKPKFSPQVTIQHPLEYTIPLYFGLFGFDTQFALSFSASLPFAETIKECIKKGNSNQLGQIIVNKQSGLTFLHALTLLQIAPPENTTDSELLKETLSSLNTYQQIDAKMKLALMSRRPFSMMFEDIKGVNYVNYYEFFEEALLKRNRSFTKEYNIPELLRSVNYGEQFFDKTGKSFQSFIDHRIKIIDKGTGEEFFWDIPSLLETDYFIKNDKVIEELLQKGVISTAMIRNLEKNVLVKNLGDPACDIFNNYFEKAVRSVENPYDTRYAFNPETLQIEDIPWKNGKYDILSPPWLLDSKNSMGYMKEKMSKEDKKYGEAIIEVRAIKNVAIRFLEKIGLEKEKEGSFLSNPTNELTIDSLGLFDFLDKFNMVNLVDFCTGLSYTLFKY